MSINFFNFNHVKHFPRINLSYCIYIYVYAFRYDYTYVPAAKRSINPDTFNTCDDRVKKSMSEASTAFLSAPYHPSPFCPFPGLSQRNYRITLLQSLSKHRQIPHQPWPQL